jgi:hypothetical protein
MFFILHNSGAGGDMVAAVIDSTDYIVTDIDVRAQPRSDRFKLKKSINEVRALGKDCSGMMFDQRGKTDYLKNLEKKYRAVTTGHDFIFIEHEHASSIDIIIIDDSDPKHSKWGMDRIYMILPEHHPPTSDILDHRIKRVNDAKKFTNKIIPFSDIVEGRLISVLEQWVDTPLNTEIYNHWLSTIMTKGPKLE